MSDSKRYSTLVNNTILFAISNFGSKIISLIIQPYLRFQQPLLNLQHHSNKRAVSCTISHG